MFSENFLVALTEEDSSVRLQIDHSARVKGFIEMIKKERIRDDLKSERVSYSKVAPSVLNKVLNQTRFSLDLLTFGFYQYTPLAQPTVIDPKVG